MMNIESGAVLPGKKDRTMITKESPIGVIDSGIGGFSVARKVQKLMPHENLLYLGDGANTPYGNHSAEEILTMLYGGPRREGAAGGLQYHLLPHRPVPG